MSRNHYVHSGLNKHTKAKPKMAQALLDEYRDRARLVVTNLLHGAMPCTAMVMPVADSAA